MDEIERLIADLHSSDAKVVVEAAQSLVKIGQPAIASSEERTRQSELLRDSVISAIIKAMDDDNEQVRDLASWALMKIDELKLCVIRLKDPDPQTRSHFAKRITEIALSKPEHPGLKEAVPSLMDTLQDEKEHVCIAAAQALGQIKDESAIPALLELAQKEFWLDARSSASDALVRIKMKDPDYTEWKSNISLWALTLGGCFRADSLFRLIECLGSCKTQTHVDQYEQALEDGFSQMKKEVPWVWAYSEVQSWVSKIKNEIAKKRDALAPDKGILLSDIPKPPNRGTIYRTLDSRLETTSRSVTERVRNG